MIVAYERRSKKMLNKAKKVIDVCQGVGGGSVYPMLTIADNGGRASKC